jgi:3-oxoacyl-[acyl-carrier-protein] synthase II
MKMSAQPTKVVITGLGLLTPAGSGVEPFWHALLEKKTAPRHSVDCSTPNPSSSTWSTVSALPNIEFPGIKSLWKISRSITLGYAATVMALEDACIPLQAEHLSEIGVVYGTTLSGLGPFLSLDRQVLQQGPRAVDPVLFPAAGPGASGCQVSITLGMQAFNITLSNGQTSALDGIHYAARAIAQGRSNTVVVGGVEEVLPDVFQICQRAGLLASDGKPRPFDQQRSGFVLAESAYALVLESEAAARARLARIYARYGGYGFCFAPHPRRNCAAAHAAMREAMHQAGRSAADLGAIFASANGSVLEDGMEARALETLLPTCPVTAIKGVLGESYSASGGVQAAAGVLALSRQILPGTAGFEQPETRWEALPVVRETTQHDLPAVLINAFGRPGNHASLLLTKCGKE